MKKLAVCQYLLRLVVMLILVACETTDGTENKTAYSTPPPNPWFIGTGGKGMSLAILAPKPSGLAANQAYLPGVVKGSWSAILRAIPL